MEPHSFDIWKIFNYQLIFNLFDEPSPVYVVGGGICYEIPAAEFCVWRYMAENSYAVLKYH